MVKVRSAQELELMRESGRINALALKTVLENIRVGVTGLELDGIATRQIEKNRGKLAFPTEPGYRWATCITINEQVVHGIPTNREIKEGDVISIDIGTIFKGWYSDTAWTVLVGKDPEKEKFLNIGEEALWLGIKQAVEGNRIGDIAHAIQSKIESYGYGVVKSLVGHGVGEKLHEDPEVPGYGKPGTGVILNAGMTLAIEVIYAQGDPEVIVKEDNWTISTRDGSLGGLFEMTVVVGKDKPEILTDWKNPIVVDVRI